MCDFLGRLLGTPQQMRHCGWGAAARALSPLSPVLGDRGIALALKQGQKNLRGDAGQFNLRF